MSAALRLTAVLLWLAAACLLRLMLGDPLLLAGDIVLGLTGDAPGVRFILVESRLPAVAVGVLAGAALGASGTLFQTLLRNPLAAPDVVGVSYGASAAAVVGMSVFALQGPALSAVAVLGGLASALLVMWVARGGTTQFVLVGIAVAAALQAVVNFLLTRSDARTAQDLLHWLVGSLASASWERAGVLALCLLGLAPAAALVIRPLSSLELGEDAAASLGTRVGTARVAVVLVAVALSAVAIAVTGPLAFVAFLSGPIARLLLPGRRALGLTLTAAAAVGAALTVTADLTPLPAGVITGLLGAPFLLWMLTRKDSSL